MIKSTLHRHSARSRWSGSVWARDMWWLSSTPCWAFPSKSLVWQTSDTKYIHLRAIERPLRFCSNSSARFPMTGICVGQKTDA